MSNKKSKDKCRYILDEKSQKYVLLPGCIGTAAFGVHRCTCYETNYIEKKEKKLINKGLLLGY